MRISLFKIFSCFRKKESIIEILDNNSTFNYTLDIKNIKIIMCDTNFKITFSTLIDYEIGSKIDDIKPLNTNLIFKEWHQECQVNNIQVTKNISINSKKYFILILPLIRDEKIIGSSMKIFDLLQK